MQDAPTNPKWALATALAWIILFLTGSNTRWLIFTGEANSKVHVVGSAEYHMGVFSACINEHVYAGRRVYPREKCFNYYTGLSNVCGHRNAKDDRFASQHEFVSKICGTPGYLSLSFSIVMIILPILYLVCCCKLSKKARTILSVLESVLAIVLVFIWRSISRSTQGSTYGSSFYGACLSAVLFMLAAFFLIKQDREVESESGSYYADGLNHVPVATVALPVQIQPIEVPVPSAPVAIWVSDEAPKANTTTL